MAQRDLEQIFDAQIDLLATTLQPNSLVAAIAGR